MERGILVSILVVVEYPTEYWDAHRDVLGRGKVSILIVVECTSEYGHNQN